MRLLLLGAHPDDIEIGCGATVLRLVEEGPGDHREARDGLAVVRALDRLTASLRDGR